MTYQATLRSKLVARNRREKPAAILEISATGRIDAGMVVRIHDLALSASAGDVIARDQLWFALRPRLDRMSWVLKPWPNSPGITGIWERDDVRQETWVVFAELLAAWNGTVSFVPYLLARFPWRLRDRILRGIGKSQRPLGEIRIPEDLLADLLMASDGEQPESVAMARRLLEELMQRQMMGASSPDELHAWLRLINSREPTALISPDQLTVDPPIRSRRKVA